MLTMAGPLLGNAVAPLTYMLDPVSVMPSGAYGFRKLRAGYTGNCIRVRRSSDNTTLDVGFLPDGSLNTPALLTFCGANDGYLNVVFDQSGNGRSASQATTTLQPQIVVGGVLRTKNSRVAAYGPDANRGLVASISPAVAQTLVAGIAVASLPPDAATGLDNRVLTFFPNTSNPVDSSGAGMRRLISQNGTTSGWRTSANANTTRLTAPGVYGQLSQVESIFGASQHTLTVDGVSVAPVTYNSSVTNVLAGLFGLRGSGTSNSGNAAGSYYSEILFWYGTNPTTDDRALIRSNQVAHFGTAA